MHDLTGRVALVIGAGVNIGQAIAKTLAKAGAAVVCNDLNPDVAKSVADEITNSGGKAMAAVGDTTNEEQIAEILNNAQKTFGVVDTLVNNAAMTINKTALNMSVDEWRRVIDVTLTGPFIVSKLVAERLVAAKKAGVIINIGSTSGHRGRAGAIAYCSSKGGVLNFTRALSVELAPHKIRVCSVSPTKTGNSVGQQIAATTRAFGEIPLGRLGNPQDHANAVLFLVSDEACFITGEDIRVDGGALATWAA